MRDLRGGLVVVIEDDSRLSAALEVLIQHWGYACVMARTPREALAISGSRAAEIAAVIADIEVDAGSSADRSARMFAEATGHLVPVLLTTSDAASVEQEPNISVLAKPFDPELVRLWLEEHVVPRRHADAPG